MRRAQPLTLTLTKSIAQPQRESFTKPFAVRGTLAIAIHRAIAKPRRHAPAYLRAPRDMPDHTAEHVPGAECDSYTDSRAIRCTFGIVHDHARREPCHYAATDQLAEHEHDG